MCSLDRNSPIPLYYQLYSLLLNKIKTKDLKPGDMLPTEVYLMEKYNVSRATVRQAILDLARNGYVSRIKSKGTFVKDFSHNVHYEQRVKGFTAISSQGDTIPLTSTVLDKGVLIPPKPISEALELKEGEKVFYIKRIRYIRGEPNTFVEDWLPYRICPGIEDEDFTNASLYRKLEEKYNVIPHHAIRTFECSCATTKEQIQSLRIKNNSPLLRCESKVYDANNRPVEFYVALINGKYTVQEGNVL